MALAPEHPFQLVKGAEPVLGLLPSKTVTASFWPGGGQRPLSRPSFKPSFSPQHQ
jgi:hypothetical protein